MRAIPRVVILAALFGALLAPALASEDSEQKPRRPADLVVMLVPHFGYTPVQESGPPVVVTPPSPSEYERARELFEFQIVANRPDDPVGDAPASIVANGIVRRGETKRIRAANRDLEVSGRISLARPGEARYEAELRVGGRTVSSTGAVLRLEALR